MLLSYINSHLCQHERENIEHVCSSIAKCGKEFFFCDIDIKIFGLHCYVMTKANTSSMSCSFFFNKLEILLQYLKNKSNTYILSRMPKFLDNHHIIGHRRMI